MVALSPFKSLPPNSQLGLLWDVAPIVTDPVLSTGGPDSPY